MFYQVKKHEGSKKSSQTTFQSNLLKVKFGDENGKFCCFYRTSRKIMMIINLNI